MIQDALAEARSELAALETRRVELESLIARAEAALGGKDQASTSTEDLTLHQALALVLREAKRPMTPRELADVVNSRGLYRTREGSPVEVNQIHARINNYPDLFEKAGSTVNLKESPMLSTLAPSISLYRDDDDGFFAWQSANPAGLFINTYRNPSPSYLVLHKSGCPHFKGSPELQWTVDYVKLCSGNRSDLEQWARQTVGGDTTLCGTCFG
jgi:hypothetical protein